MRITLVSAHYPPNFVSGGTLQPQRLARGLRARGHDVRVFAGHLDSTRTPLETWDAPDETGLPVHWVVSTPWIDWADPCNHDNPGVAARFAEHLERHPADVVHLHALQGLGAGLVEVAARSGAATVVTMHDFWWICARQFLVDREHRPCSLVVAAGDCACEDGRAHLEERTRSVTEHLRAANLILAPSRSAATVLLANGVDPDRLEVDENGMDLPDPPPSARDRPGPPPDQPVVVRYTGGSNPMKGAQVLLDAVHAIGPTGELRILAHDLADAVDRDGRRLRDTCLEVLPPYRPDQLDEVLAASDVLLLPSVMRESHSLVTREALLRGVPVIATDTIGPEEVVTDGVNGLIVPAGDPLSLRGALRAITDRTTLLRLTEGAHRALAVRSVADQLDGLERHYEALAAPPPHARRPTIGAVLFVVGIDGAPMRYRARLPAEALALDDVRTQVRHYRDPDLGELARRADAIVIYRVPATPQVLELIADARSRGVPVIFDVDDLIFDPDLADEIPALRLLPPADAALWLEGVRRYRTTMEACDAYIGSTPRLVEHARAAVGIEAHLFENGVGMALGAASDIALRRLRLSGPLRVGYFSGTTTHDGDWHHIEAAVVEVLQAHPEAELWLGGHLRPDEAVVGALGSRVRRLPFLAWHQLPEVLRDLDVNLAPLEPGSRFNDAKSAIKWLEAALVATPTIASPSAPFVDAIGSDHAGWLADRPDDWGAALDRALRDPDRRALVGGRARREALLRWSPHLQARRYVDILESTAEGARRHRREPSPGWVPVANDEPPLLEREPLEAYPPDLAGSTRSARRPRRRIPARLLLRSKVARFRLLLREDGVAGTVRGVGRMFARAFRRAFRRAEG